MSSQVLRQILILKAGQDIFFMNVHELNALVFITGLNFFVEAQHHIVLVSIISTGLQI